jgi:hypothetical protein
MDKILKWLKVKGWKYLIFGLLGYCLHVYLEVFLFANAFKLVGIPLPTVV